MLASIALMLTMTPVDPFHGAEWLTVPYKPHAIERAQWIWAKTSSELPTARNAPAGEVVIRREFEVAKLPSSARMHFACDNRAEVYLNGTHIGSSTDWRTPTEIDLTRALRNGLNSLRVVATNDSGPAGSTNPGGFIASIELGDSVIFTDKSWTADGGSVVELGPASVDPWRLRGIDSEPCPIFRKEFVVPSRVSKATARVIGLGHFQLRMNGKPIGDAINQAWSEYDKRIYFQTFDVTDALRKGGNAVGILLGNGFWLVSEPPDGRAVKGDAMPDFSDGRKFLMRFAIDIELANGEKFVVVSDAAAKWRPGPVTLSHIYAGEDFDARKEPPRWDLADFDDSDWQSPIIAKAPSAELAEQFWPGVAGKDVYRPTEIKNPKPGVWSYVFPQNASAIIRFTVRGKPDQTFRLKPSEVMTDAGEVQQLNLWGMRCTFDYTLGSGGIERHQWLFHYNGFRYVELTGAVPKGKPNPAGLPVIESIEMIHVRADNRQSGEFRSSSDLYNKTHALVDWAMRSNMSFVMTDCPHREKLGWLECAHLLMRTFAYRYDCREWFMKICMDMRDAQLANGRVLTVAPKYLMRPPDDMYAFTVEWGAASVLLPWQAYEWYGDKSFLTDNYVMMMRFVDHLDAVSKDGIAPGMLGDWYDYGHGQPPGPSRFTPTDLSATACWAMCADALADAAQALGKREDERKYRAMWIRIRESFLRRFYDPNAHSFKNNGSPQTGHAMALCADLVPEGDRGAVLDVLLEDLEKRGYQQTSGDAGHLFFIRALAEAGRSDVLHKVYSRTGTGSYGGILAKGLTAMPETWDAITVGSNSLNHCMLGHVMEWFHGWVLGIRQAEGSVGWKSVLIAPEPGESTECKGFLETPIGKIEVEWRRRKDRFELDVAVPAGCSASALLPFGEVATIDGAPTKAQRGEFGRLRVELPAGRSRIISRSL
ncbi:MAG: family 78 glycoside hydrolase catalytic domain [Armatimonadetes bacterium]|nr:family 78 glycoside hydrolase catalytic domain [Armatimonadota bacterium]